MKTLLKKILPKSAAGAWFRFREYLFLMKHPDTKSKFSRIYSGNMWQNGESASGFGSTEAATLLARQGLQKLIDESRISSVLDVPCGDYNWFQMLKFDGSYTGGDIVEELIERNQRLYGDSLHRFIPLDLTKGSLPTADLVLCRECINHLSLKEGAAATRSLAEAAGKFLVITHSPEVTVNPDQASSFRYRELNFTIRPFLLREPDFFIEEGDGATRRCLGVWDMAKGPVNAGVQ